MFGVLKISTTVYFLSAVSTCADSNNSCVGEELKLIKLFIYITYFHFSTSNIETCLWRDGIHDHDSVVQLCTFPDVVMGSICFLIG